MLGKRFNGHIKFLLIKSQSSDDENPVGFLYTGWLWMDFTEWIVITPNMLGSTTPELVINQPYDLYHLIMF